MKPFEYRVARSVNEACALLSEYGSDARILAGGTDLLIELRKETHNYPKVVVDISFVKNLRAITISNGLVLVKPLTTHADVVRSDVIGDSAPLLSAAAAAIGSPQIRNRGTIGGNVMNAAACADSVPPLIALGAKVTLQSKTNSRQLELEDLFLRPYQTKAVPDEMLSEIQFQELAPTARGVFIKLGRRNALSISRLSVAAILQQDTNGVIIDARIVPGATFPTWRRVRDAERMLVNEKPSRVLFTEVGHKVSQMMISETGRRWSTEYKEPVIAVLVQRALEKCCMLGKQNSVSE